jgi:hypothetical protein
MTITPQAAYVHGITNERPNHHEKALEYRLDDAFSIYVSKHGIADGYRKLEDLRHKLKAMALEAGKQ